MQPRQAHGDPQGYPRRDLRAVPGRQPDHRHRHQEAPSPEGADPTVSTAGDLRPGKELTTKNSIFRSFNFPSQRHNRRLYFEEIFLQYHRHCSY